MLKVNRNKKKDKEFFILLKLDEDDDDELGGKDWSNLGKIFPQKKNKFCI